MPNTDIRDFVKRCRKAGLEVTLTRHSHQVVTDPSNPGPRVYLPLTPSDHRGLKNSAALIRRIFGKEVKR